MMTKTIKLMIMHEHGCYIYYVNLTKNSNVPFCRNILDYNDFAITRDKFEKFLNDLNEWSKEDNFTYIVENEWGIIVEKSRS